MTNPVQTAGVLLVCPFNQDRVIAAFRDPDKGTSSWLLPKGHIRLGESRRQCAVRELKEEVGAKNFHLVAYAGSVVRLSIEHWGERVLKEIHWYIGLGDPTEELTAANHETGTHAAWISLSEAIRTNPWDEEREFLTRLFSVML